MSDSPITDAGIDELKDAEFVTEYHEGTNGAKRLGPDELTKMYDLEQRIAADKHRKASGIYRIVN